MPSLPASLIRRTVSSHYLTLRAATTTFAPSLTKAIAVARPIPELPPVTRALCFQILSLYMELLGKLKLSSACSEKIARVKSTLKVLRVNNLVADFNMMMTPCSCSAYFQE